MRADVLKRAVIRDRNQDVPGCRPVDDPWSRRGSPAGGRRELAHLVVAIDVRADQDRFGIKHLHEQDLIMMAIIGGDARQAPGFGLGVPLRQVVGRVFHLRGEQLVGIEPQAFFEFLERGGVSELERDRQQAGGSFLASAWRL